MSLPEFKRIKDEEILKAWGRSGTTNLYSYQEKGRPTADAQLLSCQQQLADWVKEQTPEKVREEVATIVYKKVMFLLGGEPIEGWNKEMIPNSGFANNVADQILSLLALQHEAEIEKARQEGREEVVKWIKDNLYDATGDKSICGIFAIPDYKLRHQLSVWGITGQ